MTTTSTQSAYFGRDSHRLNWELDPSRFDFEEAEYFYHKQITYHFDRICAEQGSTGSLIMGSSEVYFDIEERWTDPDDDMIDFHEVMRSSVNIAYEETVEASEAGNFDINGENYE
tara:strand:+ start:500 stop:844 length:345 start_codon:yes stop_codon:yes gene_type:complete